MADAMRAFTEHAQAMRALRVAGVLQMQQRPVPVMIAVAAWSDQQHELWKILAWNAWRGYCMRRIRFKTLCGLLACRCCSVLLHFPPEFIHSTEQYTLISACQRTAWFAKLW
jgi:hypothetical protein